METVSRAVFFAFFLCGVLCAASERVDSSAADAAPAADLLDHIRTANEQLYTNLESFVCNEEITRYEGRLSAEKPGEKAHQIDKLTAKVSFENGTEQYVDVRQNKRRRSSISTISGAWSENEYGTLLRQTQAFLATQHAEFLKNSDLDGTPAAVYGFDVSEEESPWDLEVGGRHYQVPFWTQVWVSRNSGQILRIERSSTSAPGETQISELRWSVRLAPVELNGRTWLLPKTAEYAVSYEESDRREWNYMTFSDYRRYGSEVALRFDDVK